MNGTRYAVHEVHFDSDGRAVTCTIDALSSREESLATLRDAILALLRQPGDEVRSGDLGYTYPKEYVRDWLEHSDLPALDYDQIGER